MKALLILVFAAVALLAAVSPGQATSPYQVTADDDPFLGNPDARVTLVEFGSFDTYSVAFWKDELPKIKKTFVDTGQVKFVFRDFPITYNVEAIVGGHEELLPAEEAAECAGEQGSYWLYHTSLNQNASSNINKEKLKTIAVQLGLNATAFNQCLDSGKMKMEVQFDKHDAVWAGVSKGQIPAFFILSACNLLFGDKQKSAAHVFAALQEAVTACPTDVKPWFAAQEQASKPPLPDMEFANLLVDLEQLPDTGKIAATAVVKNLGPTAGKVGVSFTTTPACPADGDCENWSITSDSCTAENPSCQPVAGGELRKITVLIPLPLEKVRNGGEFMVKGSLAVAGGDLKPANNAFAASFSLQPLAEVCEDGIDNDGNGAADCDDAACAPGCAVPVTGQLIQAPPEQPEGSFLDGIAQAFRSLLCALRIGECG